VRKSSQGPSNQKYAGAAVEVYYYGSSNEILAHHRTLLIICSYLVRVQYGVQSLPTDVSSHHRNPISSPKSYHITEILHHRNSSSPKFNTSPKSYHITEIRSTSLKSNHSSEFLLHHRNPISHHRPPISSPNLSFINHGHFPL
jgi:hypothetical protein